MRLSHFRSLVALSSVFAAATFASAAIPGTVAGFDSDPEGFQGSTIATTQIYQVAGGNPGGFVQLRKELSSGFDLGTQNSSNPGFLGDYIADGINGAGFDLAAFGTGTDETHLRFRRNTGENGWYYDFGPVATRGELEWIPFDVLFNPAWNNATASANGWIAEDGAPDFAALMASVGWIEVRVINEGSTIVGVDNVRVIPEPATMALFALGLPVLARRRFA